MAAFTCTRCGKCCASLGRHIHILRAVPGQGVYCRDELSGELFFARPLAADEVDADDPSGRCPFLREEDEGRSRCSIYPFRPRTCRGFRCAKAVIFREGGIEAGRVVGRRGLSSSDESLRAIWEGEVSILGQEDDLQFIAALAKVLSRHGYRVEPLT